MRGFSAFLRKEFLEQLRSGKALILLAVLCLFGMMSPLLAKMMPELMKSLTGSGITVTVPPARLGDAWAQFFKNIGQMGLIVVLLMFGTSLPQEIGRGTLTIPLSRGLSRSAVIAAKFGAALLCWTAGYALSALLCCGYTQYLFGGFGAPHLLFALLCLWLFGALVLALLLLCGAAVPGSYGGLLAAVLALGVLLALDAFPKLQKWNPASLATLNAEMLAKAGTAASLRPAFGIAAGCVLACLAGGVLLFHKRAL